MNEFNVGIEQVVVALVAIALDAFPRLSGWWDEFNERQKQLLILAIIFVITILASAYECAAGRACPAGDLAGWGDYAVQLAIAFIVNLTISQGAHFGSRYLTDSQPTLKP